MAYAYGVIITIMFEGMHCNPGSPQGLKGERAMLMQVELGAQKSAAQTFLDLLHLAQLAAWGSKTS